MANYCCICGKKTNPFNSSGCRFDGKTEKKHIPIISGANFDSRCCDECSAAFLKISEWDNFLKKNNSKNMQDYYRSSIREGVNHFLSNLTFVRDAKVRDFLRPMVNEIDEQLSNYESYERIFNRYYDKIKAEWKGFYNQHPDVVKEKVHSSSIYFAYDKDFFMFSEYEETAIANLYAERNNMSIQERINLSGFFAKRLEADDILDIKVIALRNILFFQDKGDIQYSTEISGGGSSGGGINVKGAVTGGMLFGAVGAIIGSREGVKINAITSQIIKHDDRYIILKYKDDGNIREEMFPFGLYDVFIKLIPDKEYSYINTHGGINSNNKKELNVQEDGIAKIKRLKELLDTGVITQQDFDEQKTRLLNQL